MNIHNRNRKNIGIPRWAITLITVSLLAACSDEQESYPNLITEFSDIHTDAQGTFARMTIDNGTCFVIANTNIPKHNPNTTYRAVVGYEADPLSSTPRAYIYTLESATVLADSTAQACHSPINAESVWRSERYINLHLAYRTQGGDHYWGYTVESEQSAGKEGRTYGHRHLSIHHSQRQDPLSYSQKHYCSIPLSTIPGYQVTDTISITVHTFSGPKTWTFPAKTSNR